MTEIPSGPVLPPLPGGPPAYAPPAGDPVGMPPYGGWPTGPPAGPPRTEGLAIASLCCSLGGFLIGLAAIAGIVLGIQARSKIKRSGGALKGSGLALAGILVGIVALLT